MSQLNLGGTGSVIISDSADYTDTVTIVGGVATLDYTPESTVFGSSSSGKAVQEPNHFTISGKNLTALDDLAVGTQSLVLHYKTTENIPDSNRTAKDLDTADGALIDLNYCNEIKILPTNTLTVFTATGGYTNLKIKNSHTTNSVTVNGIVVAPGAVQEITDFGTGWEKSSTAESATSRSTGQYDTGDGDIIDINSYNEVKILPTNTIQIFYTSGSYTNLKVKNAHATNSITVNAVVVDPLETVEISKFGGTWESS